jgi:uncharacterized protein YbbC (DUF1343 family)
MSKALLKYPVYLVLLVFQSFCACSQSQDARIIVGAEQTGAYFPLIKGKNIALVVNHTSLIGEIHLVDSLLRADFKVVKVFSPEHGFRGNADAGQEISDKIDLVTGLPIISLYGKNKKPQVADLADVDMVVFDIQDVGARFYTYISTMTFVMEACAENQIPVIILDRPNPNGFYVDGPVLESEFKSFVGLHPVPIVHGMTVGEYAKMVNGEGWLENGVKCELSVIPVENYTHRDFYELPVRPSPNLPNKNAVYLYPSLCLFEGTIVSVGRGTDFPFQVIGHPDFVTGSYLFTPKSIPGVASKPKYEGVTCFGQNLTGFAENITNQPHQLSLFWLIEYYKILKDKGSFFDNYFEKLAGTAQLRKQIEEGWSEVQIRESWQPGLEKFRQIRKKYLLYPDFE